MVTDAVGWFLLSVVSAMAVGGVHGGRVAVTIGALIGFVLAAALLGRPLVRWLFKLAGRSSDSGPSVATAVVVILGGAASTQALGLEAVFGAFVAGALIGAPGMGEVVSPVRLASLRTFVLWVGAPIFLATAGLRMDLTALRQPTVLVSALVVLAVAILGKFAGAYLGGRLSRLSPRECLALGAGMNARGVVEVVVALAGLRLGVLTPATYTIIVLVAVVTSLMAPPLLRRAMAGIDATAAEGLREIDQARWSGVSEPEKSVAGLV
jgi:Kef-type K+ transport system membrane component KefB